jgi:hypothetical protein
MPRCTGPTKSGEKDEICVCVFVCLFVCVCVWARIWRRTRPSAASTMPRCTLQNQERGQETHMYAHTTCVCMCFPALSFVSLCLCLSLPLSVYRSFSVAQRESSHRSPMERGVVTHWESQEAILDHVFSGLGIDTDRISHPVLVTEVCVCLCVCV